MSKELDKETLRYSIVKRVALELEANNVVNLGIGLPTLIANEVPKDMAIYLQAENGLLGIDAMATEENKDKDLINAGAQYITAIQGCCYFDSATSFAIIRGGHVDVSVLGALEVDEKGNLANWIIPGKMVPGMGGAMDLVVGTKKVIIAMEHTAKGKPKILKNCTLPLTAKGQVDLIVTEYGVFDIKDNRIHVREMAEWTTKEDLQAITEAELVFPDIIPPMRQTR